MSGDKLLDPDIRLNKLEAYLSKDTVLACEIAERKKNQIMVTEDAHGEQLFEGYDETNEDDSSIPLSSVIENTLKIRLPARCSTYCTHPSAVKRSNSGTFLTPSAEEEDIWAFDNSGTHWGIDNLPAMD